MFLPSYFQRKAAKYYPGSRVSPVASSFHLEKSLESPTPLRVWHITILYTWQIGYLFGRLGDLWTP